MESLAELHPLLVHFPIAFFILYVLLETAGLFFRENKFSYFIHLILLIAVITSVLALLTGNSAEKEAMELIDKGIPVPKELVLDHRDYANITIWYFLALLVLRTYLAVKKKVNRHFRLLLLFLGLVGVYFVYYTGLYGAKLVYEYGVGTDLLK